MNCLNCDDLLSERGFFCKSCGKQVRCVKCRELLEEGAVACVECGTQIGEQGAQSDRTPLVTTTGNRASNNTLSYHEDRNNRRFEATLSDVAIQGLGDVFGDLFLQRGAVRTQPLNPISSNDIKTLDATTRLPADTSNGAITHETPPIDPAALPSQPSGDKIRLLKIFSSNGDSFELSDNRLKASTGAEYLRKLTYLYLYAHECYDRKSVLESDLKDLLRSAKMLDVSGNAGKWLNKRVGIAEDGADRIKLTAKGREEAIATLEAALDPNIPDTWNPDTVTPQKRAPRKKKKA